MQRVNISIALATYNGEKYLHQQLESILNQTTMPYELVVNDDGSTDNTLDILDDFMRRAPFPVRIRVNDYNLGYARNFLAAAHRCRGDWVSFCDQDDVWLPEKLAATEMAIQKNPNASMVLQRAFLADEHLEKSGRLFPASKMFGAYSERSIFGFWVWPGFLKTVSATLFRLLTDREKLPRSWYPQEPELTHDKWTCMMANVVGGVIVLKEPAALYRRHDEALTGMYAKETVTGRVARARMVSANHYLFLSEVAAECSHYILNLRARATETFQAASFLEAAEAYQKLSEIQKFRHRLYGSTSLSERATCLYNIAKSGGYTGPPFYAMGVKSAAKDLARVIVGNAL